MCMIAHGINLFDLHKRHVQIWEDIFAKIKCIHKFIWNIGQYSSELYSIHIIQAKIVGKNGEVSKFRTVTENLAGPSVGEQYRWANSIQDFQEKKEWSLSAQKGNLKETCHILALLMLRSTEVEARGKGIGSRYMIVSTALQEMPRGQGSS